MRKDVISGVVPLLGAWFLASVVALAGSAGSPSFQLTVINVLITMVVVTGLYLFVGNSGVLSFGHIAFMAIGAYVTAWLTIPTQLKEVILPNLPGFLADAQTSPFVAVLLSGLVAAAAAMLIAAPLMRLNGIAAGIGTLSLLVIVNVVFSNWDALTNGTGTVIGVPVTATVWSTLPWVLAAIAGAFLYQRSPSGRRLRATREDAVAAQAIGISVLRERWLAFVLSAFCVGAGGALYAQSLGSLNPNQFYLDITFLTLAMLVIGGASSLAGAVLGTILVASLSEVLGRMQDDGLDALGLHLQVRPGLREVILAALMLLILIVRPQGITAGRELSWPRTTARRSA